MKKVIGVFAALCVMAGSVFARGAYDGDIQLHLGVGLDSATMEKSESFTGYTAKVNTEVSSITFDFDLSTWHLFNFNDVFGLGFVVGFNGGIGGTTKMAWKSSDPLGNTVSGQMKEKDLFLAAHFNGIIGPAVGINLGNVVKFDIGLGLAYGFGMFSSEYLDEGGDGYSRTKDMYIIGGVGFGAEVQAKFVPNSPVSPVIGYRFAVIPTKSYTKNFEKYDVDSVNYFNNEIYVGISFNW